MERARALAAALSLSAAGCAASRPVEPTTLPNGLVIGSVSIKGQGLPNFRRHRATRVLLAPLDAAGRPNRDLALRSDLAADGYVYFFNVPAGRYAPVAAAYDGVRSRFVARIEDSAAREWSVDVRP